MTRCNSESWCSHIECGNDQPFLDGSIRKSHCSYWRTGSCEEPVEFTLNPQNYIYTCKKLSKFRNIHCLFWGMVKPIFSSIFLLKLCHSFFIIFTASTECFDDFPKKMRCRPREKTAKCNRKKARCKRNYQCPKLAKQNKCSKRFNQILSTECKRRIHWSIRNKRVKHLCLRSCESNCQSKKHNKFVFICSSLIDINSYHNLNGILIISSLLFRCE